MFIDGLHTKSSNIKNHFLNSSLEDILSVSMNLKIIFFQGLEEARQQLATKMTLKKKNCF